MAGFAKPSVTIATASVRSLAVGLIAAKDALRSNITGQEYPARGYLHSSNGRR
jgi:hypothetical protein